MSTRKEETDAIDWLAVTQLAKLRANAHKSHWREESMGWLLDRLREEAGELSNAILQLDSSGNKTEELKRAVISECADVANFAAMIADVARDMR